ncbi:uncharacterized protein LOC110446145 isoform X2 [Mizuhopecten yessoensis]|uniref:uncharacterized protein LOC110446145 isoform X2 n=1 Tax=Mizuhopecten yessoensis TaxID=6573 RepID=UPI000B458DC7|nr:uncharacterized protein LOC110446145 isoform X2 [Mizuhopecten yessoensis]XP_021346818.1 uncharacterized protein LOC110446145 isoform X2 [Mizuhopecten yessoensis]
MTTEYEGIGYHLKQLVERLLQQNIPDQEGAYGNFNYRLTGMRLTSAKLPRASLYPEALFTQRGALTIIGKYVFQYNSFMTHFAEGDFEVHMTELSIIFRQNPVRNNSVSQQQQQAAINPGDIDQDVIVAFIRQGRIECKIGKIKAKFHGGSAGLCHFVSKFLLRAMRTQIENQVAGFIRNLIKDDEDKAIIAILGLFALNSESPEAGKQPVPLWI